MKMTEDCLFCKIIKGEIPSSKIYEDESVYAFLDISPVNPGHVLVIPKIHSDNFLDMDLVDISDVFIVSKKIAQNMKKNIPCDGVNMKMNIGADAGQIIFHSHLHLVPRYKGDGLKLWPGKSYESKEQSAEIQKRISNNV